MRNGVKISRKTTRGYDVVFIPEEIIQINQLNARIQRNTAAREKAAADEQARIAEQQVRMAEIHRRAEANRQRIQHTIRDCITLFAVASVAWLAVPMELATPILAAVVSVPCLGGVCYKLGTIK